MGNLYGTVCVRVVVCYCSEESRRLCSEGSFDCQHRRHSVKQKTLSYVAWSCDGSYTNLCDWREGKLQIRCGGAGNPSELGIFTIVNLTVVSWFCILSYEGIHDSITEGMMAGCCIWRGMGSFHCGTDVCVGGCDQ